MNINEILIGLSIIHNGDWNLIYEDIKKHNNPLKNINIEEKIKKSNAITIMDVNLYPDRLRNSSKPPFVLFYKGNINLLNEEHILAVVGSRNNSRYGEESCFNLLKNIKKDSVIISGLARGIDTISHKASLKYGYKTIAVLGSGIDCIYPDENVELVNQIIKEGGLIISEYPFDVSPNKEQFLARNRIIASLSKGLLLVESFTRSGALNTALVALNEGKNIGCVPSLIGKNSNCNKLIKDGANLIETSEDLDCIF